MTPGQNQSQTSLTVSPRPKDSYKTVVTSHGSVDTDRGKNDSGKSQLDKFIDDLIGRDIFVHSSHLPKGLTELKPGDLVELKVM